MISDERLSQLRTDAIKTCEHKIKCASKGHDWIVNNTTIGNFELVEMISELQNFRKKFGRYEGIED